MIEFRSTKPAWIAKYRSAYAVGMGLLLVSAWGGAGTYLGADFIESLLIGGAVLGALGPAAPASRHCAAVLLPTCRAFGISQSRLPHRGQTWHRRPHG
jgi:hypothetical protein